MKGQKVKIPAVWGLSRGLADRVSKGWKHRPHFSRAFAPCFTSAEDGQPVYLL